MEVPSLIPVVVVGDVKEAIDFYTKLGFVEEKDYTFADETGAIVHAQLHKGDSVLFLGRTGVSYYADQRADRVKSADRAARGLGVIFILQTDNLEAVVKMVKAEHLEILYGPADEWYGDKVCLFLDPFGYEWKASQPLEERQTK
jgi:PhnB protein